MQQTLEVAHSTKKKNTKAGSQAWLLAVASSASPLSSTGFDLDAPCAVSSTQKKITWVNGA